MTPVTSRPDTLDDLQRYEGKAELIGGRIVPIMPTGRTHNLVAGRIYRRLCDYAERVGNAEAYTDNMGFKLDAPLLSGRESFSPDASFDYGPFPPDGNKFNDRAPAFAVEVRSENDYGPAQDRQYEAKRKDYFFAGTQVVWDVDPRGGTVAVYTLADPFTSVVFRRGDEADAEPALPGWRLKVDDIFA